MGGEERVKKPLMQNKHFFKTMLKIETDQVLTKPTTSFAKPTDTNAKQPITNAKPTVMY